MSSASSSRTYDARQLERLLERTERAIADSGGAKVCPYRERWRSAGDRAVGIVRAALAVAETGSVLLVEPDPVDRYVSLLTRHLIVVVREEEIVATLAEAFEWLASQPRAAAYATFVTGPSRTADIERSLTIGVQGPSRLTVALLAEPLS